MQIKKQKEKENNDKKAYIPYDKYKSMHKFMFATILKF